MVTILHKDTGEVIYQGAASGMAGQDLTGGHFSLRPDLDLTGADFTGSILTDSLFEGLMLTNDPGKNLIGTPFLGATLTNASFLRCNLRDADFTGTNGTGVLFDDTPLNGANLSSATMTSSEFKGIYENSYVTQNPINFSGANLTSSKITSTGKLYATMNAGTVLTSAEIRSTLYGTYTGVDFTGFNMEYVHNYNSKRSLFFSEYESDYTVDSCTFAGLFRGAHFTQSFINCTVGGTLYDSVISTDTGDFSGCSFNGVQFNRFPNDLSSCNFNKVYLGNADDRYGAVVIDSVDFTNSTFHYPLVFNNNTNAVVQVRSSKPVQFLNCNLTGAGINGGNSLEFPGSTLTSLGLSSGQFDYGFHFCDFSGAASAPDAPYFCNFHNCNLGGLTWPSGNFTEVFNCSFDGATVNGDVQDPSGCTFNGATVDRLIISNIKKYNSKIDLSGGTFNEVDIDLSVFMGRSGYNIIFGDAVINTSLSIEGLVSGLDLSQATIPSGTSIGSSQSYKDTRMLSSKFTGVGFSGTSILDGDFRGSDFSFSDMSSLNLAGNDKARSINLRSSKMDSAYQKGITLNEHVYGFKPNETFSIPSHIFRYPGDHRDLIDATPDGNSILAFASNLTSSDTDCKIWAIYSPDFFPKFSNGYEINFRATGIPDISIHLCTYDQIKDLAPNETPSSWLERAQGTDPTLQTGWYSSSSWTDWVYVAVSGNGSVGDSMGDFRVGVSYTTGGASAQVLNIPANPPDSNITVLIPPSEFINDSNTLALYEFTSATSGDSTIPNIAVSTMGTRDLTLSGGTSIIDPVKGLETGTVYGTSTSVGPALTNSDWTIEVAAYLDSQVSGEASLVSNISNTTGFVMRSNSSESLSVTVRDGGSWDTSSGSSLSLNTKFIATLVYDDTAKTASYYIDGVQVGSDLSISNYSEPSNSFAVGMWLFTGTPANFWPGQIQEVSVSNVKRTPQAP